MKIPSFCNRTRVRDNASADPILSDKGWMFSEAPGAISDSVNQAQYLQEIYIKADPKYTGKVTVPVLWDKQTQAIVNNESREIMRMFDVEFVELATQKIDLYPRDLQQKIDETIDAIYLPINVGVYRAGTFSKIKNLPSISNV